MNNLDCIELPPVRVPDMERIRTARRKRQQQLKRWYQYDKTMDKKQKRGITSSSPPPGSTAGGRRHFGLLRSIQFSQSVILLEAAARDDLDEVRKLLSQGVCPNVTNTDGLTALHQCCIDNNQEVCRLLIRFGADVNARDTELWTPLHAAATCCHAELCKLLIDNGADLLAVNADGNMPYDICEEGTTLDLIESEMASRGITQEDIDEKRRVPEREMLESMENLIKQGGDLNKLDSQGAAPLHIAAACGYLDVAGFILQHGAIVDFPDRDGWMAIHVAACWGQFEVIEMLTNFGAKIDTPTINGGETVFDICEDEKMHERLVMLKEELRRQQTLHMAQNQANQANGNGDKNKDKNRGLVRRRSSNPRSTSIRRTSMRDKAKISWKEARQEAETCSLVVPTADGDSLVEEFVKTPVWMTSVEAAARHQLTRQAPPPPPAATAALVLTAASPPLPTNASRNRPPSTLAVTENRTDVSSADGPRLPPKTSSLNRRQGSESPVPRPRPTSREIPPSSRASNSNSASAIKPPLPHHNGTNSTPNYVHLHNAYYAVASRETPLQPKAPTKTLSQPRASPQVLVSTGAKPMGGNSPGVIASPLQPGASLTRPPPKRELHINDARKSEHQGSSAKCCVLM